MDELIKANSNGQWEILEKAKFISPEQQKANKQKAMKESHKQIGVADHPSEYVSDEHIRHIMENKTHRLHPLTHPPKDIHPDEHFGSEHFEHAGEQISQHLAREKAVGKQIPVPSAQKPKSHLSVIKAEANGQWYLDNLTKDNSVKPFGQNIYNTKANVGRKMGRTGEVREGAGRNNAVQSYTTSGSSMQAAHEAAQAKEMKAKTKASTRTMKDMSPEELKAIQDRANKK